MISRLIFIIGDSSVQVGIENMGKNVFVISSCTREEMFWSAKLIIIIKVSEGMVKKNFQ